jgi:hypothetical protein
VLGDVLLRLADQVGQLDDRRLAVAQPVEQLDPGRLAQRAEALRDQLDQVIGHREAGAEAHFFANRRGARSDRHPHRC